MNKKLTPSEVAAMVAQAEAAEKNPHPLSGAHGMGGAQRPSLPLSASPERDPAALLQLCAAEPPTDIGNGRRLLHRHGKRILNVAHVGWHGFDGRHWKEDEDGSVIRPLAQQTAELIDDEAKLIKTTEEELVIINAGRQAAREKKEMGTPLYGWSADKLALYNGYDAVIAEGGEGALEAARAKKAMGTPKIGWDAAQFAKYLDLDDIAERGQDLEDEVNGRRSARHSFAKSSAGTSKINNMLAEAAPHVARMVSDLNTDVFAVNVKGGTLRFWREADPQSSADDPRYTAHFRLDPHNADDYISKLANVDLDVSAEAPEFEKFMQRVQPDADLRGFLQRFSGYCLLGTTVEQCLVFFHGGGRNGKSTFVDTLCHVLGNYAVTLSIDSFAGDSKRGGSEATPDLARLPGARLVAASEPEMGVKLKDSLIKTLTGGEKIPVRRLHKDFIDFMPQFKIILSGNHKPRIDDNSDGIWRRVNLVPWEIQIPKAEVDRLLPLKLRRESDGIFAWMVRGALDYLSGGLGIPEKVRMATEDYREDSDPIGAFVRAACHVTGHEADVVTPETLFNGYTNWASREGQAEFKKVTFCKRFPDYARKSWAGVDDKMHVFWKAKSGTTVYKGIQIKSDFACQPQGRNGDGRYPPAPDARDEQWPPEGF